nr:uncharacterized protein CTRU02_11022 [Colletotrichum truncatum]KAF6786524.1 hypothetical protein CTRU02_11022 [Colletotrichum truncatum]
MLLAELSVGEDVLAVVVPEPEDSELEVVRPVEEELKPGIELLDNKDIVIEEELVVVILVDWVVDELDVLVVVPVLGDEDEEEVGLEVVKDVEIVLEVLVVVEESVDKAVLDELLVELLLDKLLLLLLLLLLVVVVTAGGGKMYKLYPYPLDVYPPHRAAGSPGHESGHSASLNPEPTSTLFMSMPGLLQKHVGPYRAINWLPRAKQVVWHVVGLLFASLIVSKKS